MACYSRWLSNGKLLACGQCIGCKLRRSREWAVRCCHEAALYDENSFILLTYEKPPHSLVHRDFQLFMKRLRKAYSDREIRFFMCGEYGEPSVDNGFVYRPHFHAILFNVWFEDCKYFKLSASGNKLYRSGILERLWPLGHATVGTVSFDSAAYVARYCTKKVTCPDTEDMYEDVDLDTGEILQRIPEYGRMSLRPGIGSDWIRRFRSDVFSDGCVVAKGKKMVAPRFYRERLRAMGYGPRGENYLLRHELSLKNNIVDNENDRIASKEAVVRARLSLYN